MLMYSLSSAPWSWASHFWMNKWLFFFFILSQFSFFGTYYLYIFFIYQTGQGGAIERKGMKKKTVALV
jgi:hypothetical protein